MPVSVALVLSGGGAKGEFQVGFLEALDEARLDLRFCFFTGVSVGALNATCLAQYPDFSEGVRALRAVWDGIERNDQVYTSRIPRNTEGLLNKVRLLLALPGLLKRPSLHDAAPLRKLIEAAVSWDRLADSARHGCIWAVGVTSLTDGRYYLVSNDERFVRVGQERYKGTLALTLERGRPGSIPDHVVDFVLASASMPTMFPPVEVGAHLFVDGGLRDVTPLSAPFLAARREICQPELILVVNASPRETPPWDGPRPPRITDIAGRGTEIMVNEIIRNDVEVAEVLNELARSSPGTPPLRLPIVVVWPDTTFGLDALDFERVSVRRQLREHGRAKGRQLVERFRSFLRTRGLPEQGDVRGWRAWIEASGPRADATLTVHVG
ncbi:hypothetical protein HRbin11_01698 [bacterium HR11]|nr:hypothetical protein HRbin11_01698 [bacterium HR11]